MVDATEVDSSAAPGPRLLHRLTVLLQSADPDPPFAGQHDNVSTLAERPANQGAGDDGSKPRHGERTVDREARPPHVGAGCGLGELGVERRAELIETLAAGRRHRYDGRPLQSRPAEEPGDLFADEAEPGGIDEVGLGPHGDPMLAGAPAHDGEL